MPPKKKMIGSDEKTDSKWQILVPDLIRLVFEHMNFAAFHKTRSISLDWYSTAELCIRQNPTPWIILFSSNHLDSNDVSCKLYDPHDKKTYLVRDLGFGFLKSRCLANSGSWFLMLDHITDFYLLNLFTRQRIPLPSVESIDGLQIRGSDLAPGKSKDIRIGNAVLWVDEKSRDYLVVGDFDCFLAYHKSGDNNESWKVLQPLKNEGCHDMVFKESKLYLLSETRRVTVFDFSGGDSPMQCARSPSRRYYDRECSYNLAVTLSGEVLIILSKVEPYPGRCFFTVYKMDPKSSKWSIIKSLGDEALLLDQGITVAAKDGVMKNCIYFSNDKFRRYNRIDGFNDDNRICVYSIQPKKVVQEFQHLTASSPIPFKDARWFFPTFGGKLLL